MKTRKVSTLVPATQHAELSKVAKRQGTTIGEVVAYGARLAVAVFKTSGNGTTPALAPDHRRKGE